MIQIWAIYLRTLLIYQKRAFYTLLNILISPLLFALAFGWGLGKELKVEGSDYLSFMLPGLIALSGMRQSFTIGTEINLSRFLSKVFEENILSPATPVQIVLGYILTGMSRGVVSLLFILLIGLVNGIVPAGPAFLGPVMLNLFLFSSLGVLVALTVKSHRDMSNFNSFIIIPMSFLAGTFFSLKELPFLLQAAAKLIPLTHSSLAIRGLFLGQETALYHYPVLIGYCLLFFCLAVYKVQRTVD